MTGLEVRDMPGRKKKAVGRKDQQIATVVADHGSEDNVTAIIPFMRKLFGLCELGHGFCEDIREADK